VPHTHVRCRCGGRHTETGASLFTTPLPSQHLPHSRKRFRVWREEQAASAWASAVQAASPSAPFSMSRLSAAPPRPCAHIHQHIPISHCIPVAHTSQNTHSTPQQGGRRHRARYTSCPSIPPSLSPNPLCTISEVRQERSRALLRPAPCLLTSSSYTLPRGRNTMRLAPTLAHACLTVKVQQEREERLATPCVASTARPSALMPQSAPPALVSMCRRMKSAHCLCHFTCLSSSTFSPAHVHTHGVHECE